jgi:hypothetical protein
MTRIKRIYADFYPAFGGMGIKKSLEGAAEGKRFYP